MHIKYIKHRLDLQCSSGVRRGSAGLGVQLPTAHRLLKIFRVTNRSLNTFRTTPFVISAVV